PDYYYDRIRTKKIQITPRSLFLKFTQTENNKANKAKETISVFTSSGSRDIPLNFSIKKKM
ncbi:MAG: hypothetical protein WBN50_12970, partial [Lutimonas sp.]